MKPILKWAYSFDVGGFYVKAGVTMPSSELSDEVDSTTSAFANIAVDMTSAVLTKNGIIGQTKMAKDYV